MPQQNGKYFSVESKYITYFYKDFFPIKFSKYLRDWVSLLYSEKIMSYQSYFL